MSRRYLIATIFVLLLVLAPAMPACAGAPTASESSASTAVTTLPTITTGPPETPSSEHHPDTTSSQSTTTTEAQVPAAVTTEPQAADTRPTIWQLDSLKDLDTLLSNADGYAYYYIFDPIPAGLTLTGIGSELDMSSYTIDFKNQKKQWVHFYVFTMRETWKSGLSQFDQMVVDGVTYYYEQGFDAKGELSDPYFEWIEDGHVYLVHPQEAMTPAVIRKYSNLKKVEFNIGQRHVGLDTGIPLISDSEKLRAVDRENEGIRYFTGPFPRL